MTSFCLPPARAGRPGLCVHVGSARIVFLACLAILAMANSSAGQRPYINVGRQSDLMDQPYVEIELSTYDQYGNLVGIGPYDAGYGVFPYNRVLLDTGANSVLMVSDAAADLYHYGYQTDGFYYEQGVAGFSELHVSAPYNLSVSGTDGTSVFLEQSADQVRILSNPNLDLAGQAAEEGGFTGLIGMPAMLGRVTTLDFTGWFGVTDIFEMESMGVSFPTAGPGDPTPVLPEGNGHRYSVAVDTRYVFHPEDGVDFDEFPDAPLPVWSPIPFLTAKAQYHDASGKPVICQGDFLFDTGAQLSLLTRDMAFALGLDEDGDGTFNQENFGTMTVGGIGGTVDAEVLMIDKLIVPTEQGVDLVWAPINAEEEGGLTVLVLPEDATQLPFNVLGADFLTGGITMTIDWESLDITIDGDPYFEQIQLDFRQLADTGAGTIYFDLNPDTDQVVVPLVPGDTNGDRLVDEQDAAVLTAQWGASVSGGAGDADFNDDGLVNAADAAILAANWGDWRFSTEASALVPEPSALVSLIGLAAILLFRQRRR
ncbi:MAG: PEP-CTERM sorting domain-containing protein [Pirellulales bacterium]|nr:PEP-CTERM sorting domain-containing protein [Pirellulales bacterium]